MMRKANADQIQFAPHTLRVTVDEFGWDALRRLKESGPRPGQFGYPIHTHDSIIRATGLPPNSQLAHTGLQMTIDTAIRALDVDLLARELGNWRTSSRSGPAYQGLADGIRMLIVDGRLPVGARLPSERALAEALRVSRTTVTAAYAQLGEDGYLVARRGARSITALPAAPTVAAETGPATVNLGTA